MSDKFEVCHINDVSDPSDIFNNDFYVWVVLRPQSRFIGALFARKEEAEVFAQTMNVKLKLGLCEGAPFNGTEDWGKFFSERNN